MSRRSGFATVEFALVLPLMLFLVAGVVDFTMLMRTAIAVADAARAGAAFGSLNASNAGNISGIQAAALAAAPDVTGLSATAAKTCQCSNGTVVNCSGGSCASGGVRVYVQVTAQAVATALFGYPHLPYSGAIVATTTMRAQ